MPLTLRTRSMSTGMLDSGFRPGLCGLVVLGSFFGEVTAKGFAGGDDFLLAADFVKGLSVCLCLSMSDCFLVGATECRQSGLSGLSNIASLSGEFLTVARPRLLLYFFWDFTGKASAMARLKLVFGLWLPCADGTFPMFVSCRLNISFLHTLALSSPPMLLWFVCGGCKTPLTAGIFPGLLPIGKDLLVAKRLGVDAHLRRRSESRDFPWAARWCRWLAWWPVEQLFGPQLSIPQVLVFPSSSWLSSDTRERKKVFDYPVSCQITCSAGKLNNCNGNSGNCYGLLKTKLILSRLLKSHFCLAPNLAHQITQQIGIPVPSIMPSWHLVWQLGAAASSSMNMAWFAFFFSLYHVIKLTSMTLPVYFHTFCFQDGYEEYQHIKQSNASSSCQHSTASRLARPCFLPIPAHAFGPVLLAAEKETCSSDRWLFSNCVHWHEARTWTALVQGRYQSSSAAQSAVAGSEPNLCWLPKLHKKLPGSRFMADSDQAAHL